MSHGITTLLVISLALPLFGNNKNLDFDSAEAVAVDGTIENGIIISDKTDPQELRDELISQLFYMVGLLNGYSAAGDLGHIDLKIKSRTPIPGTELTEIRYSVKMLVGWPRGLAVPGSIPLVFPIRMDDVGKGAFFKKYSKLCSEDVGDEDLNLVSFYYYYRPSKEGCPLFTAHDPKIAIHNTLTIRPSSANTVGKFPEYGKVWEDSQLVVTAIFGTYTEGATSNADAGIAAYNEMYQRLLRDYGKPIYMNVTLGPNAQPGAGNPDVEMEWDFGDGYLLNVNILLVDKVSLQNVPPAFVKRYNQRTVNSDFVSYNGHSGFGENIRSLANMGHFVKGQYQLFFVNGCDTFFYVDDSLRAAHALVNPGSAPYEYFDVITNALPSIFQYEVRNNMAIINAMIATEATYREILSQFDNSSHSIVMGEEDNHWPYWF